MLLIAAVPVMGQGVVNGMVRDAATGAALEFVNVGVLGSRSGTATDSRGRYTLTVNAKDSVTLRFSFTGYEPCEKRVKVAKGQTVVLDVSLRATAKRLDEVEVSDEKTRQSTFTHIDVQRLENAVGPASGVEAC